jgi:hypothetical protein
VIQTREMESMLRLSDGEVAVMGGLMEDKISNTTSQIPGLGDLPGVGNFFRNRSDTLSKTELVIFLKPTIIRDPSVNTDYQAFREQLPGGLSLPEHPLAAERQRLQQEPRPNEPADGCAEKGRTGETPGRRKRRGGQPGRHRLQWLGAGTHGGGRDCPGQRRWGPCYLGGAGHRTSNIAGIAPRGTRRPISRRGCGGGTHRPAGLDRHDEGSTPLRRPCLPQRRPPNHFRVPCLRQRSKSPDALRRGPTMPR